MKSLHQSPPRLITTVNWNYINRLKIRRQCKELEGRHVGGGAGYRLLWNGGRNLNFQAQEMGGGGKRSLEVFS